MAGALDRDIFMPGLFGPHLPAQGLAVPHDGQRSKSQGFLRTGPTHLLFMHPKFDTLGSYTPSFWPHPLIYINE